MSATWEIREGDALELLREMPDQSVDAIVTDPPYGLGFMGKDWDSPGGLGDMPMRRNHATNMVNTGASRQGGRQRSTEDFAKRQARDARSYQAWCEGWAVEALRVLKPGGHLLAFGGTRTYHRLAVGIEDAGFEVRDCVVWLYGSGFPKSLDVSKAIDKAAGAEREVLSEGAAVKRMIPGADQNATGSWIKDNGREFVPTVTAPATPEAEAWEGWGTALKPAHEPVVVARKSLVGTVAANVLEHGTGALNIDGCRIENTAEDREASMRSMSGERMWRRSGITGAATFDAGCAAEPSMDPAGRWPANVVLDEEAGSMLDEQSGDIPPSFRAARTTDPVGVTWGLGRTDEAPFGHRDSGGASRFFYCAKASSAERNAGLGHLPVAGHTDDGYGSIQTPRLDRATPRENWTPHAIRNLHPTVKPVELMRWLVRLVTPPGGLILDPFAGSGTTGIAAMREGFSFVGIEREADYAAIARERIRGDAPLLNTIAEVAA